MKKFFISTLIAICSVFNICAQEYPINISLNNYECRNNVEYFTFSFENIVSMPICVTSVKVFDAGKQSTIYYSDEMVIINNVGGFANLWPSTYLLNISRMNTNSPELYDADYEVTVIYSLVYDGAKIITQAEYIHRSGENSEENYNNENNNENDNENNGENTIATGYEINMSLSSYEYYNETEHFVFSFENTASLPIFVSSIKIYDKQSRSTIYYSDDTVIINSYGGNANAWSSTYNLEFNRVNPNFPHLYNVEYEITIKYALVVDGAKMMTQTEYIKRYANMTDVDDINIDNVYRQKTNDKYYNLNGTIAENPVKGRIYIHAGKKIIY